MFILNNKFKTIHSKANGMVENGTIGAEAWTDKAIAWHSAAISYNLAASLLNPATVSSVGVNSDSIKKEMKNHKL